jgi:hypothetical protein
MSKKIDHITKTKEVCHYCEKPFNFYWYDKGEKNGFSETMWKDKYHKKCCEILTGKKCKSLQEINDDRKIMLS